MITEVFLPLDSLPAFLERVREDFRNYKVELIYGTIRLIKRDDESFLAWAREDFACLVFNLHVEHTNEKIEKVKTDFRRLIDRASSFGGSFYLTYHGWANKKQISACYPQMLEFTDLKKEFDPNEIFQSNWYRSLTKKLV